MLGLSSFSKIQQIWVKSNLRIGLDSSQKTLWLIGLEMTLLL